MRLGLGLGLTRGQGGAAPVNVLANTYDGLTWLWGVDAAFSALSQDTAGATAVTAAGQPVGRATDLIGSQPLQRVVNDTFRPTYQTGPKRMVFDGDGMTTAGNVPLGVPKITFVRVGAVASGGPTGHWIGTEDSATAVAGEWRAGRIGADTAGEMVVIVREPSTAVGDSLRVENVPATRAVHVVTIDSAPIRPAVSWTVNGGSPLTVRRTFEGRTAGGALASHPVTVGSLLNGTEPIECDDSLIAIASGEPTTASLAALVADLIGRL